MSDIDDLRAEVAALRAEVATNKQKIQTVDDFCGCTAHEQEVEMLRQAELEARRQARATEDKRHELIQKVLGPLDVTAPHVRVQLKENAITDHGTWRSRSRSRIPVDLVDRCREMPWVETRAGYSGREYFATAFEIVPRGYAYVAADEWDLRCKIDEALARACKSGTLIVTHLTGDENAKAARHVRSERAEEIAPRVRPELFYQVAYK